MKEKVASIAEKELGETADGIREMGGLVHTTYSFRCEGEKYVVQFADSDEEVIDSLRLGLQLYSSLQDSGIPVPEVVTDHVKELDGLKYTVVQKLSGTKIEGEMTPEKVQEAGKYLAKIHDYTDFERDGWIVFDDGRMTAKRFAEGSMKKRVLEKIEEKAEVFEREGYEELAAYIREFFDRHRDEVPERFKPVLCHNDYSPDNVLFNGEELSGILDWDYAYAGHDQRDLVKSATAFWMENPEADWDVREVFYEGYRGIRDPGPYFQENEPLYRVETLVRIVASLFDLDCFEECGGPYFVEKLPGIIEEAEEELD